MKRVIKNGIVSMTWDADYFFESNRSGFYAAINVYKTEKGDVPVVFEDNNIFMLYDEDEGRLSTADEISDAVKVCFSEDLLLYEAFEDNVIMLGTGSVDDEDVAYMYGLSDEDIEDINSRVVDLAPYWEVHEESASM